MTTYSVWSDSLICEMMFPNFLFKNAPFGGHYVFYQSEISIWPKLLHYLAERGCVVPLFKLYFLF